MASPDSSPMNRGNAGDATLTENMYERSSINKTLQTGAVRNRTYRGRKVRTLVAELRRAEHAYYFRAGSKMENVVP